MAPGLAWSHLVEPPAIKRTDDVLMSPVKDGISNPFTVKSIHGEERGVFKVEVGKLIGPACKDIVLPFFGGGALALKLGKEGVVLTETSYEIIKINRTIKK